MVYWGQSFWTAVSVWNAFIWPPSCQLSINLIFTNPRTQAVLGEKYDKWMIMKMNIMVTMPSDKLKFQKSKTFNSFQVLHIFIKIDNIKGFAWKNYVWQIHIHRNIFISNTLSKNQKFNQTQPSLELSSYLNMTLVLGS